MASLRNIWHRILKPKIGSDGSIGMRLKRLEDLGSRRVKEFVKKENRYTNLQLLHTRKFQKRVKKHIQEISSAHDRNIFKLNIEERTGTYVYYQRQYDDALPVIYRRCYDTDHEELVLDQNELAKETGYVQTGPLKVSTSDNFVAVVVIKDASEFCNCHIYKMDKTGSSLVDVLPNVVNAEWCNDESSIVLVTSNEVQRYCIHTRTSITLLKENDPRFTIDLMKSRGQQWILVHINSKSCSEVYALDANNPHEDVRCLIKRDENIECFVDHWQDYFYAMRTSRENKEYMISRLPDNGKNAQWEGVYCPTNEKRVILDMEIFADNLLVYELDNLIPWLTMIPIHDIKARRSFKLRSIDLQSVKQTICANFAICLALSLFYRCFVMCKFLCSLYKFACSQEASNNLLQVGLVQNLNYLQTIYKLMTYFESESLSKQPHSKIFAILLQNKCKVNATHLYLSNKMFAEFISVFRI